MLYAWSGETQKALDFYVRSLEAEALYIPHTYRYALYEFPEPMRSDPRYLESWDTRSELVELARLRLEALRAGEIAGILPDGKVVKPGSLPPKSRRPFLSDPKRFDDQEVAETLGNFFATTLVMPAYQELRPGPEGQSLPIPR